MSKRSQSRDGPQPGERATTSSMSSPKLSKQVQRACYCITRAAQGSSPCSSSKLSLSSLRPDHLEPGAARRVEVKEPQIQHTANVTECEKIYYSSLSPPVMRSATTPTLTNTWRTASRSVGSDSRTSVLVTSGYNRGSCALNCDGDDEVL